MGFTVFYKFRALAVSRFLRIECIWYNLHIAKDDVWMGTIFEEEIAIQLDVGAREIGAL